MFYIQMSKMKTAANNNMNMKTRQQEVILFLFGMKKVI